jgi:hypothetical protein
MPLVQRSTRRNIPEDFSLLHYFLQRNRPLNIPVFIGTYLLALVIYLLTVFVVSDVNNTPTEDDRP